MITLSLLGQLDIIAAATGNAPVAASDVPDPFVPRIARIVLIRGRLPYLVCSELGLLYGASGYGSLGTRTLG